MSKFVVFTDLDGTLLDHKSCSFRRALPALDVMVRRQIAVVPLSSKTAAQMRYWMKLLSLHGPFVSEDGGGIFIPESYFPGSIPGAVKENSELRISLGTGIIEAREGLKKVSSEAGVAVTGFGDLKEDEVLELTGLKAAELEASMAREYDEPFLLVDNDSAALLFEVAQKNGFSVVRGDGIFHISRGCDKGRAVEILTELFRRLYPEAVTIGIGDCANDISLLHSVDHAYLVMRHDGTYDPEVSDESVKKVGGIGPHGWRMAMEEVFNVVGY